MLPVFENTESEALQQNTMQTLGLKLQRHSQQVESYRKEVNDVKTLLICLILIIQ